MYILQSLAIFILAGICEIGGGYLLWLSLKGDKPWWFGLLGGCVLALYGVVATWQTANFGRVYATYGGIFVVMSIVWAMLFDKFVPDKYDIIGALIVLLGVCVIYYAPRQ
ncbi:MAG: hypothetical protein BGN96_09610 [Bacteroidales bacterium 45-6]|nr:MAG: hypothetical protein BGN96_09610 [Bacteroidales bacterium 45-6]